MTCPADLHTHTTASDGQYTPSQLAAKALAAGIQNSGSHRSRHHGRRGGGRPGGTSLRIDGAPRGGAGGPGGPSHAHTRPQSGPECPALAELCRRLRASREERKYRIAAFLRGKGLTCRWRRWRPSPAAGGRPPPLRPGDAPARVCLLPPGGLRPLSGHGRIPAH